MTLLKNTVSPRILFNIIVSVALIFLLYLAFFKNDKVAYVDSAKLMNEYKGFATAKKTYDAKVHVWQSNIDTLTGEVQGTIKKYEKELARGSAKEQEMAKQLISSKQKELEDYQRAIQENARQENTKLTQSVVSEINSFLLRYGKEHHYKIIFIANQSGTIAYAREGLDITGDVLKELNDAYVQK